jgi:aryl carrier-like protein
MERPALPGHRGATVAFTVPEELVRAVRSLARDRLTTPYTVYLTAFLAMLGRCSGRPDLVVGTNVTTRDHSATEELIGPFFNTLPVRADLAGDPELESLLERTGKRVLAGFARKEVPFELLVERLVPDRGHDRSPVHQVLFELATAAQVDPPAGLGWSHRLLESRWAKLDLTLTLTEHAAGPVDGLFTYATELFRPATVRRLAAGYPQVLEALCRRPGQRLSELPAVLGPGRAGGETRRRPGPGISPAVGPGTGPTASPATGSTTGQGTGPTASPATGSTTGQETGPTAGPAGGTRPQAPDDPVLAVLTRLWSEVLDRPEDGLAPHDNFFRAGGRSLDMTRLCSRLRGALRIEVPLAQLFLAATIAEQAEVVGKNEPEPGFAEKVARARLRLWAMSPEDRRELVRRRRDTP